MKAIIQKVIQSHVKVDTQIVGSISKLHEIDRGHLVLTNSSGKGYNVLLGIAHDDTSVDADWVGLGTSHSVIYGFSCTL